MNAKEIKLELDFWEMVTQSLVEAFTLKYFGKDVESWWVADEVGGVLFINDYFFNLRDITDYIRYYYPKEKMFEYYDYALKCAERGKSNPSINIKNFRWLKSKKKK